MISDCKKGKDGHSKAVKEDVTATITRLPCLGGYDLNTKRFSLPILLRYGLLNGNWATTVEHPVLMVSSSSSTVTIRVLIALQVYCLK